LFLSVTLRLASFNAVGREVRVGNVPFEIIGIAGVRGVDPGGADLGNAISNPLETALRRLVNVPYADALYVQGRRTNELERPQADVRDFLRERHRIREGSPEAFAVRNQAVILRTERAAARALGVHRRDIRAQFLVESVLIALAGGLGGVFVGAGVGVVGSAIASWEMDASWLTAFNALVESVLLGVGVGTVPAMRAARLEPVAALRGDKETPPRPGRPRGRAVAGAGLEPATPAL